MKRLRLRVRLMTRFYLVSAVLAVTLVSGMATGFGMFYRLLYVLVLTLVVSYVWNWLSLRSLDVVVGRRTLRAEVGDNIEETITTRNHSRLPKYALEVEDLTNFPGYSGGMALSLRGNGSGPAGSSTSWKMQAMARKRGVYTLGPIRVAHSDPFGLFRRERRFGETDSVIVYPRTLRLPGFDVPAAELSGDSSTRKRTHQVTPQASSVREYAWGDSLSRVHWNSTARLNKLMSKEFDLGRAAEVWVLIDLHRDVQAGELEESTDEYAVTIGASLAKRYLEAQLPVGLIAYGGERYHLPAETGAGQMDRMLQYLAMSNAEGDTPLEDALPREEARWGHQSSLVVITPSPRTEWVMALRELSRHNVRVVVVLVDGSSFGGLFNTLGTLEHLYLAGLPTYVVRRGDDIPAALSRRYTGNGAGAAEATREVGAGA